MQLLPRQAERLERSYLRTFALERKEQLAQTLASHVTSILAGGAHLPDKTGGHPRFNQAGFPRGVLPLQEHPHPECKKVHLEYDLTEGDIRKITRKGGGEVKIGKRSSGVNAKVPNAKKRTLQVRTRLFIALLHSRPISTFLQDYTVSFEL